MRWSCSAAMSAVSCAADRAEADAARLADVAAAAAQFLSPIVLDLMALTVNGKQAHWHVRGANFIGVHELPRPGIRLTMNLTAVTRE